MSAPEIDKLLTDLSLVSDITDRYDCSELYSLIFSYFRVNGQEERLISWAVDNEVKDMKDKFMLCREQSLTWKILSVVLFGELGIKYLIGALTTTVNKIVNEFPPKGEAPNSEVSMRWIFIQITELLQNLTATVHLCPLPLREGFLYLCRKLQARFGLGEGFRMTCTVIFLRFLLPPLVSPSQYGLFPPERSDHPMEGLAKTAKIIQSMANYTHTMEPAEDITGKFVENTHINLVNYVSALADDVQLKKMRDVTGASVETVCLDVDRKQVGSQLRNLLSCLVTGTKFEAPSEPTAEMVFRQNFEKLLYDYRDIREWKQSSSSSSSKKTFFASTRKLEGKPHIGLRVVGEFTDISMEEMWSFITNTHWMMTEDTTLLQKFSTQHQDWWARVKGKFPFADRDFVYKRYEVWEKELAMVVMYSIEREDAPKTKKAVRADLIQSGFILEKMTTADGTQQACNSLPSSTLIQKVLARLGSSIKHRANY